MTGGRSASPVPVSVCLMLAGELGNVCPWLVGAPLVSGDLIQLLGGVLVNGVPLLPTGGRQESVGPSAVGSAPANVDQLLMGVLLSGMQDGSCWGPETLWPAGERWKRRSFRVLVFRCPIGYRNYCLVSREKILSPEIVYHCLYY